MATLNIKDFPDDLYQRLQERAESAGKPTLHSILELRGLGKEIWKDIDPVDHVRAERDSWDS